MSSFDWRPFLEQYSRDLLADPPIRSNVSEVVAQSEWMGFEPANSDAIHALETRLGVKLPESYRQFLSVSNGWRQSGGFIYDVYSCEKVEWFHVNNQQWIDDYVEPCRGEPPLSRAEHNVYGEAQRTEFFRVQDLQSTLLISGVGDSAVYLLNPEVQTPSGEWEAWFFANWNPGARRYQSFWDLMHGERRSLIALRDDQQ